MTDQAKPQKLSFLYTAAASLAGSFLSILIAPMVLKHFSAQPPWVAPIVLLTVFLLIPIAVFIAVTFLNKYYAKTNA